MALFRLWHNEKQVSDMTAWEFFHCPVCHFATTQAQQIEAHLNRLPEHKEEYMKQNPKTKLFVREGKTVKFRGNKRVDAVVGDDKLYHFTEWRADKLDARYIGGHRYLKAKCGVLFRPDLRDKMSGRDPTCPDCSRMLGDRGGSVISTGKGWTVWPRKQQTVRIKKIKEQAFEPPLGDLE